jgi:hypothetical protein
MSTIALILIVTVIAIAVVSKLPVLDALAKPLIDLLMAGIKAAAATLVSWFVYMFKLVWNAHSVILEHLLKSPEELDPSLKVRGKGPGSGSA